MSRVLLYAQHLSGVGHHVRMELLARGLARRHEVYMVDGGEPVPRPATDGEIRRVPVPRIRRRDDAIVSVDTAGRIETLLADRVRLLESAVERIRPDAVLVEHFPFSKWELRDEILRTIDAARAVNPRVRIVSSIRDVAWKTRFDTGDATARAAATVATLNGRFDALFVHSDPRFCRLDETFDAAHEIRIPVVHTGFVSEKPSGARRTGPRSLIASTGGGVEGFDLAARVVRAFRGLRPALPDVVMTLFTGLFFGPDQIAALRDEASAADATIEPFGPSFLDRLGACEVSVSRAGYNTCVNLFETGVRAVLVPSAARSDQRFRAARARALGLAAVLDEDLPTPEAIAGAVLATLAGPRPSCDLDLSGVERSGDALGELLASGGDGAGR